MPSLHLPYVNIALDTFALVVVLVLLISCLHEVSQKKSGARRFLFYQISVAVALIADIIAWIGEGNPSLAVMTLSANTVMACACRIAIIGLMSCLVASLYAHSRAAAGVLDIFILLCGLSIAFCIGNAFFSYAFCISETGHYVHTENSAAGAVYLLYPLLAFFVTLLMALFARIPSAQKEELDLLLKAICDLTLLRPDYREIQEKAAKAISDRQLELFAMRTNGQVNAAAAPQAAAVPKFCPNCGAPYEGGKFCQSCGTKLV